MFLKTVSRLKSKIVGSCGDMGYKLLYTATRNPIQREDNYMQKYHNVFLINPYNKT